MVRSVLVLDIPRTELIERPLAWHKYAKDISLGTGGKNCVFCWPGTQSYTLMPINFTPAFTQSSFYDDLKLLLVNWNHADGLWQESFEGHDSKGKFDPFCNLILPADKVPDGYPHNMTGQLLTSVFNAGSNDPVIPAQNLADAKSVQVLSSIQTFPYNQGFMLRFFQEGRESFTRGSVLRFQFAEFVLSLDTNGMAQLYQTGDFKSYPMVYQFRWCDQADVHDRHHRITIFPHSRNKIEFLCGNEYAASFNLSSPTTAFVGRSGGGVYEVPGELIYNKDTDQFQITGSAPCAVYACLEFRPYVQVSRLAFTNGDPTGNTDATAFVYDSPINLPFPPLGDFHGQMQFDSNGCNIQGGLYDLKTKATWVPGSGSQQCVFAAQFYGRGDNEDGSSSTTPELYGYSLAKSPIFDVPDPTNSHAAYAYPMSTRIASGDAPEAAMMHVTVSNARGEVDAYTRRGKIPVALGYTDNKGDVYLFEGESIKVDAQETLAPPRALSLECRGMAHMLTRSHWNEHAPNFGHDPNDPQGRCCFWSEAVYQPFEVGGFPRGRVIIEDVNLYDFRLWDEAGGGGTDEHRGATGSTGKGAAHVKSDSDKFARWKPKSDSTPYDWLDYLLRGILGWHWDYNTQDGCWHVWKRPVPNNKRDLERLVPKAVFVGDTTSARLYGQQTDLPVYTWRGRKESSTKADYAGVIVSAALTESFLMSKADLKTALTQEQTSGGTAADSAYQTTQRNVSIPLINPNAYACQSNDFKPDRTHVDFIGRQSFRDLVTNMPDRKSLEFAAYRSYYAHCFGHTFTTLESTWGDRGSVGLRKWDMVWIDSGKDKFGRPNGTLERWLVDSVEPAWTHDTNMRAGYRFSKYREDCPPPY